MDSIRFRYFLCIFYSDYWRFILLATRPETKDATFTWRIFIEKINSDLNDTLGNFIHRTLKFINQNFNGTVPKPSTLESCDKNTLRKIKEKVGEIAQNLEMSKIQAALRNVIDLSRIGNRYLNEKEPWNSIKNDKQKTADTLYTAMQIIKTLTVTLEPFIPFTAQKIWELLNLPGSVHKQKWEEATKPLQSGHKIKEAKPLFYKIKATEDELQNALEKVRSNSTDSP
jgi:methionyl-tRNA synthetase